MNRRSFVLKGSALAAAAFGMRALPGFARRALAAETGKRRTLVFLFLTGGLDGLSVLVPDEPALRDARPQLIPQDLIKLDSGLALHPSLQSLQPLYADKQLAFVHACGQPGATRSHFDAQDFLELGTPGDKSTPDGWLSRALKLASPSAGDNPLQAVALSQHLPRSLQGPVKAFAFQNLGAVRLRVLPGGPGGDEGRSLARDAFESLYASSGDAALARPGQEAFEALQLLEAKLGKDGKPAPGVVYPQGPAAGALRQVAALVKAGVGLRVAAASVGGWDTHANQPNELNRKLADLGGALAAFWQDLEAHRDEVLLVAVTEFGRTVRQNGSMGTDHGHGSFAMLLGAGVDGGKVHGRWPGVRYEELFEGRDLAVTTDVRSVLASAARAQLGVSDVGRLFPGFDGQPLPLVRS